MGGIAWFAVPLTFSSVMGLAAVALASSKFQAIEHLAVFYSAFQTRLSHTQAALTARRLMPDSLPQLEL